MQLKFLSAISIVGTILASAAHAQAATLGPIDPLTGLPATQAIDGSAGTNGTTIGYSSYPNAIDGSAGANGTNANGYSPIRGTIDGSAGASTTISPYVFPAGSTITGSSGNTYTIAADGSVTPVGTGLVAPALPSLTVTSSNPNAFTATSFTVAPAAGSTPIVFTNPLAPCVANPASCASNPQTTFASFGNLTPTLQASAEATAKQYTDSAKQAATDWAMKKATTWFQTTFPGLAGLFGGTASTAPPASTTAAERQVISPASSSNVAALVDANNKADAARRAAQIAVDANNSPNVSLSSGSNPTTENGTIVARTFLGKDATNDTINKLSDSSNVVKNSDKLAQTSEDDSLTAIQNLKSVATGIVHQNDSILDISSKQGLVQAQLLQQTSESQELQRKIALSEADASIAYGKRNVYLDAYIGGISRVKRQP
jgi:hypothetical protein